jgi:hypothetical protein
LSSYLAWSCLPSPGQTEEETEEETGEGRGGEGRGAEGDSVGPECGKLSTEEEEDTAHSPIAGITVRKSGQGRTQRSTFVTLQI